MKNKNAGFGFLGVILVVAIVAAIGGGTYYSSKKSSKAELNGNTEATTTVEVSGGTSTSSVGVSGSGSLSAGAEMGLKLGTQSSGSIRSLLGFNKDLTCTISHSTTTAKGIVKTEGTVFITGSKMRGDFTISGGATSATDAHMIREGDNVVAWSGKQGAKMSLSSMTSASAPGTPANTQSQVNLDQNVSYKCADWKVDSMKFTVPSDVKIYDISSVINATTKVQLPR